MIRAACHCTRVRLVMQSMPDEVLDCNCTLCRRYGAIWAYAQKDEVELVSGSDHLAEYCWGDRELAIQRCNHCGCITHVLIVNEGEPWIGAVNVRMVPTVDPQSVTLRRRDNAHTGRFWTRADAPIEASNHPPMPLPGPEDWR